MGFIRSIATAVGIGESPAERARRRAAQAREDTVRRESEARDAEKEARDAEKEARQKSAQEEGKGAAARKLSLIATTPQGILKEAATGRKKLLGN